MVKKSKKVNYRWAFATIVALATIGVFAAIFGFKSNLSIEQSENGYQATIEYAPKEVPVEITDGLDDVEKGQGEIKVDGEDIKTVEAVESTGPVTDIDNAECPEGEECGRGATSPVVNITSPQAFANDVIGQCLDVDGYYGAQCWDEIAAYFLNYTGHTLYTCGTGAAKGTIQDGCWQKNAGNEFTMVWDATKVQPGDIAVYSTGQWGHIGMAMGYYNNGYFTLLGQNQGGRACPNGGAAGNIINLSTRDFIGAFRPKIYIKPEPKPEPKPTPTPVVDACKKREVKAGDTLGAIMLACTGKVEWGKAMDEYASHWYSVKFKKYLTVYDGWTSHNGIGLYAGDTIEYRAD